MDTLDIRSENTYNDMLKELKMYEKHLKEAEEQARQMIDSEKGKRDDITLLKFDYECILKCEEELSTILECVLLLQHGLSTEKVLDEKSIKTCIQRMHIAIERLKNHRNEIHDNKLKYLASGRASDAIRIGENWDYSENSIDGAIKLEKSIYDAIQWMSHSMGSTDGKTIELPSIPPIFIDALEPSVPSIIDEKKPVKVKVAKFNKVDFSVITDEIVRPGNSSCIDVFMYTKSQRHIVNKALQNAEEKKTEATRSITQTSVKQGSSVTVLLTSDDVVIENDSETLIWSGDALDFKFRFSVPETYKKKAVDFACNILFDGIHITRLYFSVKLNSTKSVPVRFVRKDSKKAFVSYSHKDKQKVVDRLIAIQEVAPRIRFWMDNQSMNAGEPWRKAIASAIKSSDVFLLFWSSHSKASSEVEKEWRYALELEKKNSRRRNGSRFITPVPLEEPSKCPPPEELSNLHFGDPSFDSDVDGIEDVSFVVNKVKPKNIKFIS